MSKASREKRSAKARTGSLDKLQPIDVVAEREGEAITNSFSSHTIDFGIRLNRFYVTDGEKFPTGKKHRHQAVGRTVVDHALKVRKQHKSKHIDLLSANVHRRVTTGKVAYQTEIARRVLHLIEYRVGIVRPTNNTI